PRGAARAPGTARRLPAPGHHRLLSCGLIPPPPWTGRSHGGAVGGCPHLDPQPTESAVTDLPAEVDVIVVGGGNAGFAAAHAAAQRGRRVLLLEKGAAEV